MNNASVRQAPVIEYYLRTLTSFFGYDTGLKPVSCQFCSVGKTAKIISQPQKGKTRHRLSYVRDMLQKLD